MNLAFFVGDDQPLCKNEATFWCIVPIITKIREIHAAAGQGFRFSALPARHVNGRHSSLYNCVPIPLEIYFPSKDEGL